VFFPGDIADPRKGGDLMLRAWNVIHREIPSARLVLAGSLGVAGWFQDQFDTSMVSKLDLVKDPAARAAVEFRGPGAVEDLPVDYARSSVTVLPSVKEMFGMVLTESLACGTPVVASAHDGPGAIIGTAAVGNTVDLRDFGDLQSRQRALDLADAVIRTIDLARRPGTKDACRDWASQWSLDKVGPQVEEILERAASGRIESFAGGVIAPQTDSSGSEADLEEAIV
jgi:phosphatidylinositol alpha-mannosyltransferase